MVKKEAFEVVADVKSGRINVMDDSGNVIKWLDLAHVIFCAVEADGFDCNGAGLAYKK